MTLSYAPFRHSSPGQDEIEDRMRHLIHNTKGARVGGYGSHKAKDPSDEINQLSTLGWELVITSELRWVPYAAEPLRSVHTQNPVWLWEKGGAYLLVGCGEERGIGYRLCYTLCALEGQYGKLWDELKEWFITIPLPEKPNSERVAVDFSYLTKNGPVEHSRLIDAPAWDDIRHNYPDGVQTQLKNLVNLEAPNIGTAGSLILLHGPPGVGKTTFLRSLMREWSQWTNATYVVDPEILFREGEYLYSVLAGASETTGDSDEKQRWRALILEDVEEFIGVDAKHEVGQAFARLLNTSDGFLGQGTKLLIILTTNIDVDRIAPALIRPGRCLAQIEVGTFTKEEAERWLGHKPVSPPKNGGDHYTLADLYGESRGNAQLVHEEEVIHPGQYL